VRPDLRPLLGTQVTVLIDRPLGSRHPDGHAIWYPVNYGYIPGTVSGDGEPVDAYVLGVFEPVAEVSGVVAGLILRRNDAEDKVVVAPAGRHFTAEQIRALVDFQERFFDVEIITSSARENT
jgi:inorganic pyrophosphatase